MAASPWTWFCRRSLPVERAFCLPTVTKCLLTVYHLIIEVFSLILSGLYKQWKESRGHSCYQACCHCSSSRLSAWWGWARAPQSSAAPININNTNNKWTGGRKRETEVSVRTLFFQWKRDSWRGRRRGRVDGWICVHARRSAWPRSTFLLRCWWNSQCGLRTDLAAANLAQCPAA